MFCGVFFFFFFQAEDGIRDLTVTGVQTCALPIALDVPSERKIFTSLAHYFSEQTILFISHRISALKWVDRIVVLNQGVVEDEGTHEQLIGRNALYVGLHSVAVPAPHSQRFNTSAL